MIRGCWQGIEIAIVYCRNLPIKTCVSDRCSFQSSLLRMSIMAVFLDKLVTSVFCQRHCKVLTSLGDCQPVPCVQVQGRLTSYIHPHTLRPNRSMYHVCKFTEHYLTSLPQPPPPRKKSCVRIHTTTRTVLHP